MDPTLPTFKAWPQIEDLLHNGGLPGVTYTIVPAANLVRRRAQGLDPIVGSIAEGFVIEKDGAAVDCLLMGEGTPIRGASPESGVAELHYDEDLDAMLHAGRGVEAVIEPPIGEIVPEAPCGKTFKGPQGIPTHIKNCDEPACVAARSEA